MILSEIINAFSLSNQTAKFNTVSVVASKGFWRHAYQFSRLQTSNKECLVETLIYTNHFLNDKYCVVEVVKLDQLILTSRNNAEINVQYRD